MLPGTAVRGRTATDLLRCGDPCIAMPRAEAARCDGPPPATRWAACPFRVLVRHRLPDLRSAETEPHPLREEGPRTRTRSPGFREGSRTDRPRISSDPSSYSRERTD